jgi:phosphatidylglycerol:prolipoprotein diacylglycerol transferase
MVAYPHFSPVLLQIGPLAVRWYGLMYVLGFALGSAVLRKRLREVGLALRPEEINDFLFYLILGVILGGRTGYVLFYNLPFFLAHPAEIPAIWHGGMSFHGGLLGTLSSGFFFCRRRAIPFYRLADAVIPAVPIGLGLGRLGNFINGELWGRTTDVPWAMVFPADATGLPRHPSQLYEFAMEGVFLFCLLWVLRRAGLPEGALFWVFILGYGLCRIIGEQFREPDPQLSFILPHITAGMILSFPMFIVGLFMLVWLTHRKPRAPLYFKDGV